MCYNSEERLFCHGLHPVLRFCDMNTVRRSHIKLRENTCHGIYFFCNIGRRCSVYLQWKGAYLSECTFISAVEVLSILLPKKNGCLPGRCDQFSDLVCGGSCLTW